MFVIEVAVDNLLIAPSPKAIAGDRPEPRAPVIAP